MKSMGFSNTHTNTTHALRGIPLPLLGMAGSCLLLLTALLLWWSSLAQVNVRGITDYGLAAVLPVSFFVVLALLTLSFCFVVSSGSVS